MLGGISTKSTSPHFAVTWGGWGKKWKENLGENYWFFAFDFVLLMLWTCSSYALPSNDVMQSVP